MKKLLLLILLTGCAASQTTQNSDPDCGIERWLVKVASDKDTSLINWQPIVTTVAELNRGARISPTDNESRREDERSVYQVTATLTDYKLEDDGDIHLVLRDLTTDSTLVAEIPSPDCPEVSRKASFLAAREWLKTNVGIPTTNFKKADKIITVIGIGFFDQNHGQRGKAYNNRELHPIISIK